MPKQPWAPQAEGGAQAGDEDSNLGGASRNICQMICYSQGQKLQTCHYHSVHV